MIDMISSLRYEVENHHLQKNKTRIKSKTGDDTQPESGYPDRLLELFQFRGQEFLPIYPKTLF